MQRWELRPLLYGDLAIMARHVPFVPSYEYVYVYIMILIVYGSKYMQ